MAGLVAPMVTHAAPRSTPASAGRALERANQDGLVADLPAEIRGRHFLIVLYHGAQPARFLVDTASTATLVSPEYAARVGAQPPASQLAAEAAPRPVSNATGETITLAPVRLPRLQIGRQRFTEVPALLYDCSELSAHFGVPVDGVLGFPLLRDWVLTLDYPGARLRLAKPGPRPAGAVAAAHRVAYDPTQPLPAISLQIGTRTLSARLDSGSDGTLLLDPTDWDLRYQTPPRPGGLVGTLTGDRPLEIARLADDVWLAGHRLATPVIELAAGPSLIGGGWLSEFAIKFDPLQREISFYRASTEAIPSRPLRSLGLSFRRGNAYWRVLDVVPGSPADEDGLQIGDLITKINDEPVAHWDHNRLQRLLETASTVRCSLLTGRDEIPVNVAVFDLVP